MINRVQAFNNKDKYNQRGFQSQRISNFQNFKGRTDEIVKSTMRVLDDAQTAGWGTLTTNEIIKVICKDTPLLEISSPQKEQLAKLLGDVDRPLADKVTDAVNFLFG